MPIASPPPSRPFCWDCHRPQMACFCSKAMPFRSSVDFAMVVHPDEVASTIGTAWILRRSILNLHWFRSDGHDLDTHSRLIELIANPQTVPFMLYPSKDAINLDLCSDDEWRQRVPENKRQLFFVVDGTWSQAPGILRNSKLLQSLPKVSFEGSGLSEYGFKKQPKPACLSCVEGVHRVIEKVARRNWAELPPLREHDRMLEIFREMVQFQTNRERKPRFD